MRKLVLNFAIAVKVILSVSQLAYGGERPASAPPIDERLTGIESRVNGHDTEIAELSRKIDALKLAIRCPCPRGGRMYLWGRLRLPQLPQTFQGKTDSGNRPMEGNPTHQQRH